MPVNSRLTSLPVFPLHSVEGHSGSIISPRSPSPQPPWPSSPQPLPMGSPWLSTNAFMASPISDRLSLPSPSPSTASNAAPWSPGATSSTGNTRCGGMCRGGPSPQSPSPPQPPSSMILCAASWAALNSSLLSRPSSSSSRASMADSNASTICSFLGGLSQDSDMYRVRSWGTKMMRPRGGPMCSWPPSPASCDKAIAGATNRAKANVKSNTLFNVVGSLAEMDSL